MYAQDPWNEIIPNLWMGGHDYWPEALAGPILDAQIAPGQFDAVYSLFHRPGHEVPDGTAHRYLRIPDRALTAEELGEVKAFAGDAYADHVAGKRVAVRCQAGLNRSGLVVGLVLMRHGWAADDAIAEICRQRSPNALFNTHFVQYLREADSGR